MQVYGVEPATSAVITTGVAGKHKIQGIGAGFIPATYLPEYVDVVMPISDEDSLAAARFLARQRGILVGISSGAAFHAAAELARKEENAGKLIVALLPDTGERDTFQQNYSRTDHAGHYFAKGTHSPLA